GAAIAPATSTTSRAGSGTVTIGGCAAPTGAGTRTGAVIMTTAGTTAGTSIIMVMTTITTAAITTDRSPRNRARRASAGLFHAGGKLRMRAEKAKVLASSRNREAISGTQCLSLFLALHKSHWVPAFAGMTKTNCIRPSRQPAYARVPVATRSRTAARGCGAPRGSRAGNA